MNVIPCNVIPGSTRDLVREIAGQARNDGKGQARNDVSPTQTIEHPRTDAKSSAIELARIAETRTDGAARGEAKLAWTIPSRDRRRRSQRGKARRG